ncbi:protein unc-50 homolog [Ctenocephalides felis]|uniref:protein unc-50 homolog n=1 Tax=Ctenocephalides felis TaxID=7515 RepID=UPI000E6E2879|nr:protein unc-50 homolog [Ctenocephalides felis]
MKQPRSPSASLFSYSRSTSPLPAPINHRHDCMSAFSKIHRYVRRLFKFQQMDFEFAVWQMVYLFIAPQKVYRNFNYRKQTKSQFARDDPAFLVLFTGMLCVTSLGFGWVFNLQFSQTLYFLLYVIFVDCIFMGVLVATMFWFVTNRYLRINPNADVEWGYAFDVHLNAFVPPLIILHFLQLFFYYGVISHDLFISRLIGNSFWMMAVSYYIYITFLGYSCIPELRHLRLLLAPLPALFVVYLISLAVGWNVSETLINFYLGRVL